jgi:hypothetical protein
MTALKSADQLKVASQSSLVDFLRTDLDMCSTFSDVAEMELSIDRKRALEAFNKAVRGCETIQQFVIRVQDETKRGEIEQALDVLRTRLTAIQIAFDHQFGNR